MLFKQIVIALLWAVVGGLAAVAVFDAVVMPTFLEGKEVPVLFYKLAAIVGAVFSFAASMKIMRAGVLEVHEPSKPAPKPKPLVRIAAGVAGLFCAILVSGLLGIRNPLPTGPADAEFVSAAMRHLFAMIVVGVVIYHAVVALLSGRLIQFLKK